MSVYMIIEYKKIENEAVYNDYIIRAEPIIKKYNGEYIVRTNKIKYLNNDDCNPKRIVIIKFPSNENLDKCFNSEEYKKIKLLREDSTISRAVIVEGYVS